MTMLSDDGSSASGKQKPTFRWVHKMTPPRLSAVGVISLSARWGDSMPDSYATKFDLIVKMGENMAAHR
jgi:hypothetical protein